MNSMFWTNEKLSLMDVKSFHFLSRVLLMLGRLVANDHLDFFLSTLLLSVFLIIFSNFLFPPSNIILAFKTFLLQILGSGVNLAELSRKMCSCWDINGKFVTILRNFGTNLWQLWDHVHMVTTFIVTICRRISGCWQHKWPFLLNNLHMCLVFMVLFREPLRNCQ